MTPGPTSGLTSRVQDQRGVALPLAMIMLMILTALMVAFAALSKHEPVIAANHLRTAQARAMAESGMERALWALSTGALTAPASGQAATTSPYNGTYQTMGAMGGFILTVTGSSTNEVTISSVGWTPTNDTSDAHTKAHRKMTATLTRFQDLGFDAPCALCLNGDLSVTGNVTVDARASSGTGCGDKKGIWTSGTFSRGGSSAIYGSDGNNTANQSGTDYVQNQSDFSSFQLSTDELATLRSYAKSHGTHLKPTSANGTVTLSNVANGVVFIDTYNEGVPTASDTTLAEIKANSFADNTGFHGWIIVNGDVKFTGNFGGITGMIYVVGKTTQMTGMGNSGITGLMIVERLLGGDSSAAGNANVTYSCTAARGDDQVPTNWFMKAGSYREASD